MSQSGLMWKLLLIAAVIAGSIFVAYPPEDKVNLGLDLKGGAHILIQVDVDSSIGFEIDQTQNRIGGALADEGLRYGSIKPVGDGTLEIRGTDPSAQDAVRDVLERWGRVWELQSLGGGAFRMTMSPELRAQVARDAVESSLITLRKRVDGLGVSEPLVSKQGADGDRILVQLPGVQDLNRVKDILKEVALLEWKVVSYPPGVANYGSWVPPTSREQVVAMFGGALPDDTIVIPESSDGGLTLWWPLKRVAVVSGGDLRGAYASVDPQWGNPVVEFELAQDAGRRFQIATTENLKRKMAVVLTNNNRPEVLSAPIINSPIRDRGIIQGNYTTDEAQDFALKLRSGALPANLNIIEERTVGPSLGRDSIRKGLRSGIAGFIGVMLFMVIYYRLSGINAVVALALNVLLVFAGLALLPFLFGQGQATLTLPGIAGLILTIGMAVDSNVLIFERIREELRNGKTVRSAVDQGFSRAFMTILDCNITTIVAAFFLWSFGSGPVKGFAVTLTIGIVASVFTAVFVSRQLFELVLSRKQRDATLSI